MRCGGFVTALVAACLFAPGCGLGHRHLKFFAPEHVVYADQSEEPALTIEAVDKHGERRLLVHDVMHTREGRTLRRPAEITYRDTLVFSPRHDAAELRLWIRGTGWLDQRALVPVRTVTGSLRRRFANEIVFLPVNEPLTAPLEIPVPSLSSPYNVYTFGDGDLLVVETTDPAGAIQRDVLVRRDVGPYYDGFAGVLVTLPTKAGDGTQTVAPILAAGPTLGWRTRRASGPGRILDTFELVLSFGIGSTVLNEVGLEPEIRGIFNAALVGSGLRLFRVFSVQGFVNTTSFFREEQEARGTLAVGLDATGLAALLRDARVRLFRENPVTPED